ncbi:hypothetical protein N7507_001506 [Penicillium longicatenatum]|nr:hypothetical protein N7507_001506 [Penicillium longicatenatum]
MKPLNVQLKDRYSRLKEIRESLWNLKIEAFPSEMIERLGIDFCRLDINTGATSPLVTPYFLPRISFPSCRDMKSDGLKDPMIEEGRDRDPAIKFNPSVTHRFFTACLCLAEINYGAELKSDLLSRTLAKESVNPNS